MFRALVKKISFVLLAFWCCSVFVGDAGTIAWAEREVYHHLSLEELLEVAENKIEDIDRRIEEEEAIRVREDRREQARDRYDRAEALLEDGQLEQAREELQKAEMLDQDKAFRSELRKLKERIDREGSKRTRES